MTKYVIGAILLGASLPAFAGVAAACTSGCGSWCPFC
jgi:hypothetical protein